MEKEMIELTQGKLLFIQPLDTFLEKDYQKKGKTKLRTALNTFLKQRFQTKTNKFSDIITDYQMFRADSLLTCVKNLHRILDYCGYTDLSDFYTQIEEYRKTLSTARVDELLAKIEVTDKKHFFERWVENKEVQYTSPDYQRVKQVLKKLEGCYYSFFKESNQIQVHTCTILEDKIIYNTLDSGIFESSLQNIWCSQSNNEVKIDLVNKVKDCLLTFYTFFFDEKRDIFFCSGASVSYKRLYSCFEIFYKVNKKYENMKPIAYKTLQEIPKNDKVSRTMYNYLMYLETQPLEVLFSKYIDFERYVSEKMNPVLNPKTEIDERLLSYEGQYYLYYQYYNDTEKKWLITECDLDLVCENQTKLKADLDFRDKQCQNGKVYRYNHYISLFFVRQENGFDIKTFYIQLQIADANNEKLECFVGTISGLSCTIEYAASYLCVAVKKNLSNFKRLQDKRLIQYFEKNKCRINPVSPLNYRLDNL